MGNRHFIFSTVLMISTLGSAAYGETLYIRASAARLRSSPSLLVDDTIVGRVGQNRTVQVLERKTIPGKGTWLRVKSGGKEGWVNAKITSTSKTSSASVAAPKALAPKTVAKAPAPKAAAKPDAAEVAQAAPKKAAQTETPKVEAPKPAAKTEVAKPEAPKTEPAKPAPKTEVVKPEAPKAEPAKPAAPPKNEVAKPEPPATDKSKLKPNVPVVDKVAADGAKKCITEINESNKDQASILAPLIKSGQLHDNWASPRGAAFSVSDRGRLVVTLHKLPTATVKALVAGTGYSVDVVQNALDNGVIQFNATVCKQGDSYSISLQGTGVTDGRTGYLALAPNKNGFQATGEIAKSKISENFSAR